jgi:hypothetical protein
VRAHTITRTTAAVSTCEILRVSNEDTRTGAARKYDKVQQKYRYISGNRKRNTDNIAGCHRRSYGFQVAELELRKPLTNPDMERTEVKNAVV